jgi:uncharacterized protein (TIGR02145 family)
MNKFTTVLAAVLVNLGALFAQNPQSFKYQTVVRNSSGDVIGNQNVSFRISIRNVSANGTILYSETHSVTTNSFGLAGLNVGQGTPVTGSFESIQWGINDKFLSVELDPNGGSSYVLMGTTQLLNVPYSLHAGESAGLVTMTSAQRDAVTNPSMGMQIFNTDTRKINYYDGYGWLEISGVKQTNFNCGNPLLDSRDGTYYNTVEIAGMCWMAENLNHGTQIDGAVNQEDNGVIEKYCYQNNPGLCNQYGGLYQWNEMMQYTTAEGSQGICPTGWHIPANTEWTSLVNATGGFSSAGLNLAIGGSSGFDALFGGYRNLVFPYPFAYIGSRAFFWTSTQLNTTYANYLYLENGNPQLYTGSLEKLYGLSVRCVED